MVIYMLNGTFGVVNYGQFMYKYAGKENLFVHQIEIPQFSEDMNTVWFSHRLHTCTYGR